MNHFTDCADVLCHECRAVELELIPKFRARIATLDDYQTVRRNELERAIERIEWYATLEGPVPLSRNRCEWDSGSATDCQPLCSDRAEYTVSYRNGTRFDVNVCKSHRRSLENRVWFCHIATTLR